LGDFQEEEEETVTLRQKGEAEVVEVVNLLESLAKAQLFAMMQTMKQDPFLHLHQNQPLVEGVEVLSGPLAMRLEG
jgi:hypothetical protein